MDAFLLVILLLLVVWLMVRLSRGAGRTGIGIRVVRSLLLLVVLVIGVVYCWFRIQRAHADVERSRKTARQLVELMDGYEAERTIASAIATTVGGGEIFDSVEALVDLANDGDVSRLRQAAQDARYCLAEVNKEMGPLELLIFTQPTPCRAMFHAIGEPADLADAGATFGNMAARATGKHDPGEPGGPACREWKIEKVQLILPKSKQSGAPWDLGGDPPDSVISLRVGSGQRVRSPVMQGRHELRWKPEKPLLATPGAKLEVHVYDSDAIEDDFAYGYEAVVPTHARTSWTVGKHPNDVELFMNCVR